MTDRKQHRRESPDATPPKSRPPQTCHAHDFIIENRKGKTRNREKGVVLSGGQRQRSRSPRILKDAPILVLDEATNALGCRIRKGGPSRRGPEARAHHHLHSPPLVHDPEADLIVVWTAAALRERNA